MLVFLHVIKIVLWHQQKFMIFLKVWFMKELSYNPPPFTMNMGKDLFIAFPVHNKKKTVQEKKLV